MDSPAHQHVLPVFRLTDCNLTDQHCEIVASALQSSNSLRELDLSNNHLQDSAVELLSVGLKSTNCQLNILRFVFHIDSNFNIYSFMCFICIYFKDCSTCTLIHEYFMVKRLKDNNKNEENMVINKSSVTPHMKLSFFHTKLGWNLHIHVLCRHLLIRNMRQCIKCSQTSFFFYYAHCVCN